MDEPTGGRVVAIEASLVPAVVLGGGDWEYDVGPKPRPPPLNILLWGLVVFDGGGEYDVGMPPF